MNRALAAVLLLLCSRSAGATDLAVTDAAIARVPNTPTAYVTLNVAWPSRLRGEIADQRKVNREIEPLVRSPTASGPYERLRERHQRFFSAWMREIKA